MDRIHPRHFFRRLGWRDIEVDDHGILPAANEHTTERLVSARIDLLMRYERRNVDEIAGSRFRHILEMFAPSHPGATTHDVDDALELAVMMRAGLGVRVNRNRSRPQLACTGPRVRDRRGTRHPGRLRRVQVERGARDDLYAVVAPIAFR